MSTTSDSIQQGIAEQNMKQAEALLAMPPLAVVGESYWDSLLDRARRALGRVKAMPGNIARQAAAKVREAARAGIDAASDATDTVKQGLKAVALAAALVAALPLVLLAAVVFASHEAGVHRRVQAGARQFLRERYGF